MSNPSNGSTSAITGDGTFAPTSVLVVGATLPTQPITATLPSGIDPTRVSYSLILGLSDTTATSAAPSLPIPLVPLSTSGFSQATLSPITLAWEEQAGQLAVRLTATLANADTPQGPVHQLCALAAPLVLSADWGQGPTEIWRGKIWTWTFADDGAQTVEIVGYDSLMYLTMTIEIDTSGNLASNVNGKVQWARTTVTAGIAGGSP